MPASGIPSLLSRRIYQAILAIHNRIIPQRIISRQQINSQIDIDINDQIAIAIAFYRESVHGNAPETAPSSRIRLICTGIINRGIRQFAVQLFFFLQTDWIGMIKRAITSEPVNIRIPTSQPYRIPTDKPPHCRQVIPISEVVHPILGIQLPALERLIVANHRAVSHHIIGSEPLSIGTRTGVYGGIAVGRILVPFHDRARAVGDRLDVVVVPLVVPEGVGECSPFADHGDGLVDVVPIHPRLRGIRPRPRDLRRRSLLRAYGIRPGHGKRERARAHGVGKV